MRLAVAAALICATAAPVSAQEAKPDAATADLLRDIHNRGALLYNARDAAGCYRLYEGALRTVRGFLGHRPESQGGIDAALAEAEKTTGDRLKAFRLHQAVERLRRDLTAGAPPKAPPPPAPPPVTPAAGSPAPGPSR